MAEKWPNAYSWGPTFKMGVCGQEPWSNHVVACSEVLPLANFPPAMTWAEGTADCPHSTGRLEQARGRDSKLASVLTWAERMEV